MSLTRILLATALCVANAAAAPPSDDELLDAAALDARLAALCDANEFMQLVSLGVTREGRALSAVEVRAGDAPLGGRQGLLVVAGLDGRRLSDSRVLLGMLEALAARDDLAERLGGRALVVVPRGNPDGAEASLGRAGPARATAGNRLPDDADRDGRTDEDGPSDLDGDGRVLLVRVEDAAGEWVVDEHDPRALRKARTARGERGRYLVHLEGSDDDGDGAWDEDDDGGVRVDRNFPALWSEHAAEAGAFPLSEPEAHALARYVLDHPGLVGVLALGEEDTLVSTPKKAKDPGRRVQGPLDGVLSADVDTLGELARRFEAHGAKEHAADGVEPQGGGLLAWAYQHAGRWPLGVTSWAAPTKLPKPKKAEDEQDEPKADGDAAGEAGTSGGGAAAAAEAEVPAEAGAVAEAAAEAAPAGETEVAPAAGAAPQAAPEEPTSDADSPVPAAVLAWLDAEHGGAGFVPWTEFEHDELGTVEIGGLPPRLLVDPPYAEVADLVAPLTDFVLDALATLPALSLEDVEMTRHGGGLYTLEAALVNEGVLPTAPRFAADVGTVRPIRVRLVLPPGVERVSGPAQVLVDRLDGGGGRHELRWVLAGARSGTRVVVTIDSDTATDLEQEIILP